MLSPVAVAWITLDMVGLFCLLLVLATFLLVKSLPQRKNPFLINFIMTTFLATIPPCILFITGNQGSETPPPWICKMQSVLMDGIAPMFGVALLVLVFHTWSELRAMLVGEMVLTTELSYVKWGLILAPYIVMASWTTASVVEVLQPSSTVQLSSFVYCATSSVGTPVRQLVGVFMMVCGSLEIFFEVWIAYIIITPLEFYRVKRQKLSSSAMTSYHANLSISLRILVFSVLQLTPIILAALNLKKREKPCQSLNQATQILESMDGLATFLVFGTQKDLLQAWKFWIFRWTYRSTSEKNESDRYVDGAMV